MSQWDHSPDLLFILNPGELKARVTSTATRYLGLWKNNKSLHSEKRLRVLSIIPDLRHSLCSYPLCGQEPRVPQPAMPNLPGTARAPGAVSVPALLFT